MMRSASLGLSFCALLSLSTQQLNGQQQCTNQGITCGAHLGGRMENAWCRFDTGGIFASYSFFGIAGQHIDAFMTSYAFRPRLYLYTSAGGYPVAADNPAITITELQYDIPNNATYYFAATSENASAVSGAYSIDFYCSGGCVGAFIRGSVAASSYLVQPGGRVTLTVSADGTPPLDYTWYDDFDPLSTIGSGSATFTTPPLNRSTRFRVHVTNACGAADGFTEMIRVQSCGAPTILVQPQSVTVPLGAGTTLYVTVGGDGPFSFEWYAGDRGDTSHLVSRSASLSLAGVQLTSTFWVRVRNSCGGYVDSNGAFVSVAAARHRAAAH